MGVAGLKAFASNLSPRPRRAGAVSEAELGGGSALGVVADSPARRGSHEPWRWRKWDIKHAFFPSAFGGGNPPPESVVRVVSEGVDESSADDADFDSPSAGLRRVGDATDADMIELEIDTDRGGAPHVPPTPPT